MPQPGSVAGGSPTPLPQPSQPISPAEKGPPGTRLVSRAGVFWPLGRLGPRCGPGISHKQVFMLGRGGVRLYAIRVSFYVRHPPTHQVLV